MPFKRFGHCVIRFNSTSIFVVGGFNESFHFQSSIFSFNSKNDLWDEMVSNNQIPCEPPEYGYQTNCALQVLKCPCIHVHVHGLGPWGGCKIHIFLVRGIKVELLGGALLNKIFNLGRVLQIFT